MSETIGLAEAVQLIEDAQFDDPRILEFMERVDEVATDILKRTKDDPEYAVGAISVIQANVMAALLSEGFIDLPEFFSLLYDKRFIFAITVAFKMSVGLAALEELR